MPWHVWAQRFIVDGPNGCRDWIGGSLSTGYGSMRIGDRAQSVHRLMAAAKIGRALTADEEAMHLCDRPRCVNPDHLEVGTHQQNMAQMNAKLGHHQLNDVAVRVIRYLAARGMTQRRLALAYGVSQPRISRVVHGTIWRAA